MGAFVFRLWRLGWARERYSSIGGWRRLFWRLWWLEQPSLGEMLRQERLKERTPTPTPTRLTDSLIPMHWSPDLTGRPFCGEPLLRSTRWTAEFEYVTCERCKRQGGPVVLQHWVSSR